MLREIVKPTSEFYNVHIPKEYINRKVEIVVLPLFDLVETADTQKAKKDFDPKQFYGAAGSSKSDIDDFLLNSKSEWE
jgi:hypothetical protein